MYSQTHGSFEMKLSLLYFYLFFYFIFTGGKEAQKFPGAGSFHALLHSLQEPRTRLQGINVELDEGSKRLPETEVFYNWYVCVLCVLVGAKAAKNS